MAPRGMDGVVVVLGGGLIGLTIAHQLARRGRSVHVLSRSRSEAAGFVAAGMLAPHAEGLAGPLLELGQRSLERIPAWVAEIEADSGLAAGLWPCGIVVPFSNAAERDAYPTERACVALGVVFEEGSEVSELLVQGGRLEGVRRRRIEGSEAVLPCGDAVLTCGAWSAQLLPQLPVRPIKGQMLSLQGPRQALRRVLFGPGTYLVPRDDGLLVVGATSEPEAGFSAGLTPQGQRQLQDGLAALLPEAAHWPPMERWWGFRPGTPDEAPLLGPSPIEGLTLATGHYRNGVLLAAITADLLLQEPLEPELARLLAAFRWDRFGAPQADPFSSPSATARV
ncbi:MAG: FAD-dependent oxidoreductase [Cyanobacteria bacterium]|nr:FAD-dependent oxidoreductase [Cyanobacteriota bacterium]